MDRLLVIIAYNYYITFSTHKVNLKDAFLLYIFNLTYIGKTRILGDRSILPEDNLLNRKE